MTDKTNKNLNDAYGRRFMIHVCKDGTVTYRDKSIGEKVFNGVALPVFSVDTADEAERIQVRFCKLQYGKHPLMPGKPWYKLNEFSEELEDLDRVRNMFAAYYGEHKDREATAALVSKTVRTRKPRKTNTRKDCASCGNTLAHPPLNGCETPTAHSDDVTKVKTRSQKARKTCA